MAVHADILIDRSALKKQITLWRMLAVLAMIVPLALFAQTTLTHGTPLQPYVARISIEGIILDDPQMDALFKDLAEDHNAKSVILRIDSPGGTVVGGEQLYLNVKRLAAVKPVVVVMRSLAASAAYMATLGATRVYASEGTITGSIGVMLESADFTGLAEKLGVQPVLLKSGANKASPNPLETMTEENRRVLQSAIMDSFDMFVRMVAEGRKLPRERVLQLADGRIYTGRQALKVGLIDAIGGEGEAIDWLEKTKKLPQGLDIVDREPEREKDNPFAGFLEEMTKSFVFFPQKRVDGLTSIWQPQMR